MTTPRRPVIAYHVTLSTYGFWLPNDPRGSGSTTVRAEHLRPFGPAIKNPTRRSVAGKPHDRRLREAAKEALQLPPVTFTGRQALSVGTGFGKQVRTSGYIINACAILPRHVHMVFRRHSYKIERVVGLLKQAATERLLTDGLHPFAELRDENGVLPCVWAYRTWKVFLFTEEEIRQRVIYVENNPLKEGKPRQRWSFVTPLAPPDEEPFPDDPV